MFDYDPQALAEATVVLFDPVRANLQTTRGVMAGLGLRRVEAFVEARDLRKRLQRASCDLVVIEAHCDGFDAGRFVSDLRQGAIGVDPFVPLICTTWDAQASIVAELINAGADDVMLRPFSAALLAERLHGVASFRKPFVVTSTYVGPDRGAPGPGRENADAFVPPNALAERLAPAETRDPVGLAAARELAKQRLMRERCAKLARRVAMAAEVTLQADTRHPNATYVLDLTVSTDRLIELVLANGDEEVCDLAQLLERVVRRAVSPDHDPVENARLARELALALYLAYATVPKNDVRVALEETLSSVRQRLDRARKRRARRASILAA